MHGFFAACSKEIRQHAPYFALSADKQENEVEVARVLREEMLRRGEESYDSIRSRRLGNDPPDCEAVSSNQERVGIEVTELVDEQAVKEASRGTAVLHNAVAPLSAVERISTIVGQKTVPMCGVVPTTFTFWSSIAMTHVS